MHSLAQRVVAISSGDVTRAYARVIGSEPGPVVILVSHLIADVLCDEVTFSDARTREMCLRQQAT